MRKQDRAAAQQVGQGQTAVPLGIHRGGLTVAMATLSAVAMVFVKLHCVGATLGGLVISVKIGAQPRLVSKPLCSQVLRLPHLWEVKIYRSVFGVNGAYGVRAPRHVASGHRRVADNLMCLTAKLLGVPPQMSGCAS